MLAGLYARAHYEHAQQDCLTNQLLDYLSHMFQYHVQLIRLLCDSISLEMISNSVISNPVNDLNNNGLLKSRA